MFISKPAALFSAFVAIVSGAALGNPRGAGARGNKFAAIGNSKCPLDTAKVALPSDQTAISVPAGQNILFVALGRGVQNYTCSAAGTYTSIGAVAELFDVSCMASAPFLQDIPKRALAAPSPIDVAKIASIPAAILLGPHTFVNTAAGLAPKFDFTASQKDDTAFVIASKSGAVPAPTDPTTNVPWLQLKGVDGSLAATVFRTATAGGQPPASCTPDDKTVLSVQYAALYYFLK